MGYPTSQSSSYVGDPKTAPHQLTFNTMVSWESHRPFFSIVGDPKKASFQLPSVRFLERADVSFYDFIEDPQGIPSIHFLTVSRECRRLILITNYYYPSRNYYYQGSGVITCAPHLLIYAYSYEFTDTFLMCFTHHTSHNSITFTHSKVGTTKTCLISYK